MLSHLSRPRAEELIRDAIFEAGLETEHGEICIDHDRGSYLVGCSLCGRTWDPVETGLGIGLQVEDPGDGYCGNEPVLDSVPGALLATVAFLVMVFAIGGRW